MNTKKVLGLDIGTNSIGAALINLPEKYEDYGKGGNIEWIGSRIIPLDADYLQKFEHGAQAETKAAFRRGKRGSRRLKHRYKLRRKRLIQVLKELKWIDASFPLDDSRKFKQDLNENGYSFKISRYLPFSEETISEFKKELDIDGKKRFDKKRKKEYDFLLPEDWMVYYLRKKALTQKIEISELVRILYLLNQRRGFKSSRKDLKDTNVLPYDEFIKRKERNELGDNGIETQFVTITKIKSVTFREEKKDKKGNVIGNIYTLEAEDPKMQTWEETRKKEPDWAKEVNDKGEKIDKKDFTFLVVQKIDKNGKHTQNKPQMPKADDWALCTTALSEKIEENKQHPGEYFFDELRKAFKANRNYKIRQYPVYRWRYQKELEAIWNKQCELNMDLKLLNSDKNILIKLVKILYPTQAKNNMSKLTEFQSKDLLHIISNDIIYYQRELKSQKNSISECRYEKRKGIDGEFYGLKCIPRSSPLFQEFRIWQDVHNIKVLKREEKIDGKTMLDVDVTALYVDDDLKGKLFDLFQSKATISEKEILNLIKEIKTENDIFVSDKKDAEHSHRINLFRNRDSLKGNETLARYRSVFKKAGFDGEATLNKNEKLLKLWHIDYSITSSDEDKSKKGITTALLNLLPDNTNKEQAIKAFCKLSELKREYGSYSGCAIKKLLPVMRCGEHWTSIEDLIANTENALRVATKKKNKKEIEDYLKYLKNINIRAEQVKKRLSDINNSIKRLNEVADDDVQKQVLKSFIRKDDLTKGLNTYQAAYLIYDKHSEKDKTPIKAVEELSKYIQKEIPNNSLRNPIVEQIVKETMYLVRDIWKYFGTIDEIHIELGRDLKNNAAERRKISDNQQENFDEKQRIKSLLYELLNNGIEQYNDENEIETANFEVNPNPESPADIDKFRIWRSLNKQSEFDWMKKVKDEKIPTEQEIKKYTLWLSQNCRSPYTGKVIPLSKIFDNNQYEIEHIIPRKKMKNDSFNNLVISEWGVNKAKGASLAANFISESKGECKYGDVEYKLFTYDEYEAYCKGTFKFQKGKLKNLLATEVPEDFIDRQLNDTRYIGRKVVELLTPIIKNENAIIFTGGSITAELKNNWGLNKVWKEIILPRFERLEEINGKKGEYIIQDKDEYGNPVLHLNVKENPQLNLKRIDHRHHALDALIIAATTREHIRYLNSLNAADSDDEIKKFKLSLVKAKIRDFKLPWEKFTEQTKNKLEELVVSFKTNKKIVSKPKNRTAYFKNEDGKVKKEFKEQKANVKWMSVRKSMFKEPQGIIYLKEIYEEKNITKAIEIQINRMLVQDTPEMKIASYIYDQEARTIIKDLIDRVGISLQEKVALLKEIKRNLKKNPLKNLSGNEYRAIRVARFEEYAAKRVTLDDSFDDKKINKIPYAKSGKSVLGKLLHEHLKEYEVNSAQIKIIEEKLKELRKESPSLSNEELKQMLSIEEKMIFDNPIPEPFKGEGLENLTKKVGKPVKKITIYEKKEEGSKFGKQYVEVDSGSNVYFVMYENQQTKKRTGFTSIPTHKAIENIIKGQSLTEDREGCDKIILAPGDLVYVPTKEERDGTKTIDWKDNKHLSKRIYKIVSFSKKDLLCVKANISDYIIPYDRKSKTKGEIGWDNKSTTTMEEDVTIKEVCIKLKINRLGDILKA